MNFDDAIASHTSWKHRLSQYLAKRDNSMNVAEIGAEDRCVLGQWIRDQPKPHSETPELVRLKKAHLRFHQAAADLVRRANAGESVSQEMVFGAGSEFSKASSAIIQAIVAMKKKAAQAAAASG